MEQLTSCWSTWGFVALAVVILVLVDRWCRLTEHLVSTVVFTGGSVCLRRYRPSRVELRLWQGSLALRNIQLQPDFVNSWDLPFLCQAASISCIRITLPWAYDSQHAVILHVEDVAVVATTRRYPQHCVPENFERQQAHSTELQRAAKLSAVDRILWNKKPPWPFIGQAKAFIARNFFYLVTRLLEVNLHNLSIAITLDQSLPWDVDHRGQPVRAPTAADGIGSTLTAKLQRLNVHNGAADGYGVLSTDVNVQGISFDIEQPRTSASGSGMAPDSPTRRIGVVRRWNVSAVIGWRLASGIFDRVAQRKGSAKAPVFRVDVFAHALLLHYDAAALRSFLGFQSTILHFLRFSTFYRLRPQVAVATSPQRWWQHAGRIILHERSAVLGSNSQAIGRRLPQRRALRQEHERLYLRQRLMFWRLALLLCGRLGWHRRALQRLEGRLTDEEAAQFRWWAWAKRRRGAHAQGAEVAEELAATLDAMDMVLMAQGVVRQKRSRPLRAQLQLHCPKIALAFEHGSAASAKAASGVLPKLTVSAKELRCTVLAGSHESEQLQSGSGPLSVQASCSEFHVSHATPNRSDQTGSASTSTAQAKEKALWLIKSPSGSPPVSSAASADSSLSSEAFLTLRYKQPALRAVEPSRLRLVIAPIDAVYSQAVLLHVTAFLNAAWPPPTLDPLTVRTSVTLREIVTERLVGPRRPHQLQKHQQSQQQVQVNVGDVRLLLPCGEASSEDAQRRLTRTNTFNNDPTDVEEHGLGDSMEDRQPSMAVLVLGGFSAATAPPQQNGGRAPLQSAISNMRSIAELELELDEHPFILANPPPPLGSQRSLDRGAQLLSPQLSLDRHPSMDDSAEASPVHQLSRMSVAGAWDKLSGLGEGAGSSRQLYRTSTFPKQQPAKPEKDAWMRRRPGATLFEILQVKVSVQAFLARPVDVGLQSFDDCAQVVEPFSITTSIDRCAEPAPRGTYRRVVQIDVTTTDVHLEMSQYVKRELHSLAHYLHSSFVDEELTSTISRHFAKRGAAEGQPLVTGPPLPTQSGTAGHQGMEFNFGGTLPRRGNSSDHLLRAAPSSALTETLTSMAEGSEHDAEAQDDGRYPEHSYGLVLALQVHLPLVAVHAVQSLNADFPDHAQPLFQVCLQEMQCTLAAEDSMRDIRFAVGAVSVEDHAREAHSPVILGPTPRCVDEKRHGQRPILQRFFQAWRKRVAQRSIRARNARDSAQHLLLTTGAQLSGHITSSAEENEVHLDSSFLCLSVEIGAIGRLLSYVNELSLAKPREPLPLAPSGSAGQPAAKAGSARSAQLGNASSMKPAAAQTAATYNVGHANCAPARTGRAQQSGMSLQVYAYLLHVDVIMEDRRFATIMSEGLTLEYEASKGSPHRDLLLKCCGLQIMDQLCPSPHLSQALAISSSRAEEEPPLQVSVSLHQVHHAVAGGAHTPVAFQTPVSHHRHGAGDSGGGGDFDMMRHGHSRAHERRLRRNMKLQYVVRVECENLLVTAVCRFLYDWMHFKGQLQQIMDGVVWEMTEPATPVTAKQPQYYRPVVEVTLTECRLDIPRNSFSKELYSLTCARLRVLLPLTETHLEKLKPQMHSRSGSRRNSLPTSAFSFGQRAWGNGAAADISSPFAFGAPDSEERSGIGPIGVIEEDFFAQFHHWEDSTPVLTAIQMETVHLTWKCKRGGLAPDMRRHVWDSPSMLLSMQQDRAHTAVWIPWASAIAGEVQYQLVLACLWENAYEPSTFGPPEPVWHPVGARLPKHPSQPEVLGVDRSQAPVWEVEVQIHSIAWLMEKVPVLGSKPGCGPSLAKVRMRDVQITVGTYPCGSMSIVVCSAGLRIHDKRQDRPQPMQTHQRSHDTTQVLAIGPDWHDPASGLASEEEPRHSHNPRQLWSQVRHAVRDGLGPFVDPHLLSARSSFQWDPVNNTMPFTHRRLRSFRENDVWRRSASRAGGTVTDDSEATESLSGQDRSLSTNVEPGDGFFVEYVMQANPKDREQDPAVWGPHVAECVMRGARLQWPYAGSGSFLWNMCELFQNYVWVPWVSPFPEPENGSQWMYINLLVENSHLFLPLHDETLPGDAPTQDVHPGLGLNWSQLRIGYFYGGDGECVLRFNAHDLAAVGRLRNAQQQDLSAPFRSSADVQWHKPRASGTRQETSIVVQATHLKLVPAFAHVPLVHAAMRIMQSSMACQKQETVGSAELRDVGHGITPIPEPFRVSRLRVHMTVDSLTMALIDDRYGNHIEVLAITAQEVDFEFGREQLVQATLPTTFAKATLSLAVMFLNSAVDATEPMLEAWPFQLEYSHKGVQRNVSLHSTERLNVIVTPSAFRSVGDARSFVLLLSQAAAPELSTGIKRSMGRWLSSARTKVSTLYRLVNRSGLRLSYWVDAPGGGNQTESYSLPSWEESPLQVEPVEKTVILPDTQLQVVARTISMQFEGNWTPVSDIVVDKVGKYAYIIGSPHDTAITPIVMDVTLDVRTKVLTVHSPFRIENCTSKPLEFAVHLFPAPNLQDSLPARHGGTSTSKVPSSGPLMPGLQCYLPAPAIWGGVMYLRALDYKLGLKDKIDLEGSKLREKQGLYTCPPEREGEQPFHCCLEVKEELIKMSMKDGNILNALPEYVMRFHPPLVIHNVLPYEIVITLADSQKDEKDQPRIPIPVGESVEVYQFSMARKIRMTIQMQDYKTMRAVNIHIPPSQYLDESARGSLFADLPGLRLSKSIQLVRDSNHSTAGSPLVFGHQGSRLTLRLHNKMNAHSRAREVVVFCPYWIINKTNMALHVKDTTPQRGTPILASPGLGEVAQPLPFSSSRGSMRLSVHTSFWSRTINLETLGMHHAIHVMGPGSATTTARQHANAAASGEEMVRYDSETVIIPRSVSPTRRRNASRMGSRFGSMHKADSWESIAGNDVRNPMPPVPPSPSASSTQSPQHSSHHHNRRSLDVGHLPHLSMLACGSEPKVVSGEGDYPGTIRRHEFAVETGLGPSIFHRTKIITVTSRYMLFNNSSEPLQYGQRGTSLVWQLPPGARYPFHWDSADSPFQLCIRPAKGNWNWSGAFQIESAGDFGLWVYNPQHKRHHILPVDIALNGASNLITVGKGTLAPPYRIENRCEGLSIRFQQKELDDREDWEQVEFGQSVDYAWEEPLFAHRLRVGIESETVTYNVLHEYNLDVIKAHPVIKLRRSQFKMVQKMASTMGRAFTSGMNIATKSGLGSMASASSQSQLQPPGQDQPELDARYVYVGVHADGPTRVLCFSDTRDQYTRGTNEESIAVLGTKLKRLEDRIRDVNEQLQTFNDRQGIDMSLAMSVGGENHKNAGDLQLPLNDGLRSGHARMLSWEGLSSDALESTTGSEGRLQRGSGHSSGPSPDTQARLSNIFRSSISLVRDVKRKHLFRSGSDVSEAPDMAHESPDMQAIAERHAPPPAAETQRIFSNPLAETFSFQTWHNNSELYEEPSTSEGTTSALSSRQPSHTQPPERQKSNLAHLSTWQDRIREPPMLRQISTPVAEIFGRPSIIPHRQQEVRILEESSGQPGSPGASPVPDASGKTLSSQRSVPISGLVDPEIQPAAQITPRASMMASRLGLPRLKRRSSHPRAATIGSAAELEALRSSPPAAKLDKDAKPSSSVEILGGELVVNIDCAQGLMSTWRNREDQVRKAFHVVPGSQNVQAQLRRLKGPKKGDVYCVLTCEGQTKRTSLAVGHQQPVWKEEVTFRAVQITSDLQVSLYGRGRLGNDIFLGEVAISLREMDEVASDQAPDFRNYILARRTAKEKVSGEISLACSWRVTPLDVASIKVKAKQTELDHKEEVLALLLEKYASKHGGPSSALPSVAEAALGRRSVPDAKHLQSLRGHLAIKVIEARNIGLPADMLHAFFTLDAYAVVTINTEAGPTSRHTRVVRNNLMPIWNEKIAFDDVALSNALTLAIYDHKKLTADVHLGQASLPVMRFSDGKPHYLWLPVHGNSLGRKSVGQAAEHESHATGELHVRVQWSHEESEEAADTLPSIVADLGLCGVGMSFVDASFLRMPREVLHTLLEDIRLDFRYSSAAQSSRFSIRSVQIDDQLLTSSHPVVLAPTQSSPVGLPMGNGQEADAAQGHHGHVAPPFVEIKWEMLHHNPSILYFKSLSVEVQEMDVVLEEDFMDLLGVMARDIPSEELWQMPNSLKGASLPLEPGLAGSSMLMEVLDATINTNSRAIQRGVGRKWYFEKLDLQGIRCNLTLVPHGGFRDVESSSAQPHATRYRMASALGIHIIEINSVPLRVNALQLKNAFVTPRALLSQLMRHLFFQALHETHKILGQVEILGSPIVLGTSLIAGLRQFITEPLKARNPKQFVVGLGHGTLALGKYGAFGVLLAFEQLLGGTAKGLAMLTMDQEYINRFRVRPSSYRQRMLLGLQAAGVGIYEGFTGVLREPITGWQDDGAVGALLGLVMGTSGMLLKPTSGVLCFFARTLGGLGAGIRAWGDDMVRAPRTRIRSPRQFAALAGDPNSGGEALNFTRWRATIARLQQGRYAGEPVLDFLQNKDHKALVITTDHIIYLNTHRQRIRWAFSIGNLTSVTASGLVVLLHHQLSMRAGGKHTLRIPVRKRVECRTRDLHQSLIVKLSRAISRSSGDHPDALRHPNLFTESLGQDNLHVMHQERMHPMAHAASSPPPSPSRQQPSSRDEAPAAVLQSMPEAAAGSTQPGPAREAAEARPAVQPRESVRFAGSPEIRPDSAAAAPARPDPGIDAVLGVARHLSQEVGAASTSARAASQHLRTLALTCHEWSNGASESQSEFAATLASLAVVARKHANLDSLQLPQSRAHVCSTLQLLLATAERLCEY